jgi:hypothetical protein
MVWGLDTRFLGRKRGKKINYDSKEIRINDLARRSLGQFPNRRRKTGLGTLMLGVSSSEGSLSPLKKRTTACPNGLDTFKWCASNSQFPTTHYGLMLMLARLRRLIACINPLVEVKADHSAYDVFFNTEPQSQSMKAHAFEVKE